MKLSESQQRILGNDCSFTDIALAMTGGTYGCWLTSACVGLDRLGCGETLYVRLGSCIVAADLASLGNFLCVSASELVAPRRHSTITFKMRSQVLRAGQAVNARVSRFTVPPRLK
jgi:hypothetical protein